MDQAKDFFTIENVRKDDNQKHSIENEAIIGCQKYPYLLRKLLATSYQRKENTDTMRVSSAKEQTPKTSVRKDEEENDCISFVIGRNLYTQNSVQRGLLTFLQEF